MSGVYNRQHTPLPPLPTGGASGTGGVPNLVGGGGGGMCMKICCVPFPPPHTLLRISASAPMCHHTSFFLLFKLILRQSEVGISLSSICHMSMCSSSACACVSQSDFFSLRKASFKLFHMGFILAHFWGRKETLTLNHLFTERCGCCVAPPPPPAFVRKLQHVPVTWRLRCPGPHLPSGLSDRLPSLGPGAPGHTYHHTQRLSAPIPACIEGRLWVFAFFMESRRPPSAFRQQRLAVDPQTPTGKFRPPMINHQPTWELFQGGLKLWDHTWAAYPTVRRCPTPPPPPTPSKSPSWTPPPPPAKGPISGGGGGKSASKPKGLAPRACGLFLVLHPAPTS